MNPTNFPLELSILIKTRMILIIQKISHYSKKNTHFIYHIYAYISILKYFGDVARVQLILSKAQN